MKAVLLALAFAACPDVTDDPVVTLHGWNATLRSLGQAYCQGELSAEYLREVLGDARRDLLKQEDQLSKAHYVQHAAHARDTIELITRIDRRVGAADRAGACALISQLDVTAVATR